jgi:hypothetical protein
MAVKAVWELRIDRQNACAIKEGTEGCESAGFDHSRPHKPDVLGARNEWDGAAAGLLIPFEDYSVRIGHTARPTAVWLVILASLGPVLWGQHPVGQVLTEEDVWNEFRNDLAVVVGPGPANGAYMGGMAGLESVNTAVKRLRGSHKVSLTVGKGVAGPIVD